MELSTVAHDLYGLPLREFTAARNARALEARNAGDRELAESIKRLRKPSAGASMVNLVVRDQPQEIERLIKLGATLRDDRDLDGTRIREATKEKADLVGKLLRQARTIAKGAGLALSQSIEQELEATLDAAFSDFGSAQSVREGCLISALRYSGLGFDVDAQRQGSGERHEGSLRGKRGKGTAEMVKATDAAERAQAEAREADEEVERAARAVKSAEADLERLRAALTVSTRRASKAHEKEAAAKKKRDLLMGKPTARGSDA